MLGIGNVVTAGSKVASVVRKDLEAWYKEGKSQAPLGEEKINNGYFSLGPNLIKDGPYWFRDSDDSTGDSISADGVALTPGTGSHTIPDSGFRFLTDSSSTHIGVKQNSIMNTVSANNNFYQISYTIVSNNGTGGLKFNNTEMQTPPVTVGPHVIYSDTKSSTNAFLIERRDGGQVTDITIKDVEVREVNPGGNGWLTNQVDVWRFKDGYAQYDHSVNVSESAAAYYITPNRDGNNNNNTFLVANRKYKVCFRISNTLGLANDENARIAITRGSSDTGVGATGAYAWYTDGYYEVEFQPSASGDLRIYAHQDSAGDFRISEISCREITHSIKDSSPNSHEAKLFSGTCLKFDGSNSEGNPGDILTLGYTKSVTVWTAAFWLGDYTMGTSSGHDNYDWIIGAAQTQKNIGLRRSETGGPFPFFRQHGVSDEVDGENVGASYLPFTGYQTGSYSGWKRWVFASDGTHIRLYVDGIYYGKVTPSSSGSGTLLSYRNFMAGAYQTGSHGLGELYAVDGSLSDLQIYHKCWSESDVKYDYNNPDKDVFDRINQPRVLTPSLIPSIENSGLDGTLGDTTTWGAQQLNDGWNDGSGDAQFYLKSGGSITFGPINGSTRLYPPQLVDDVNGLVETKSAVQEVIGGFSTRKYVVKYTILDRVGNPNLQIYTGNTNQYVNIPSDIGAQEFEFTYLATGNNSTRSNFPLLLTVNGSRVTISDFSIHRVLVETPTIQSYDCEVLLRLNEGYGSKLYNAAPILGEELILNNDFSGGVQGNGLPNNWEHHSENTSTAEVGTFKGKDNVVKIVTQGDNLSQSKLAQDFTFKNSTLYSLEVEVFIESGNFRVDTEDSNFADDFILNSNTGTWQTLKTVFKTTSSAAGSGDHIFVRSSTNTASEIYVNKISVKEITRQRAAAYIDGNNDTTEWRGQQPDIPQFATSNYSKRLVHEATVLHYGTLPTPMHNKAPNDFTVSLWYLPGRKPAPSGERGTLFGFVKELNANLAGTQTFQSFSIEHWADENQDGSGDDFYVWSGDGQRAGETYDDAQQNVNYDHVQMASDYDSDPGQLTNIVVTVSSAGVYTIYNDGILKASGTPNWKSGGGSYSTVKNFVIGSRRDYTASSPMFGFIDEISLFNKVLTAEEVEEIYNAGNALDIRDHSCYYGDEKCPLGGFDSALPSSGSGFGHVYATKEVVNGELKVTTSAGQGYGLATFTFTAKAGSKYRLTCDIRGGTSDSTIIKKHTSTTNNNVTFDVNDSSTAGNRSVDLVFAAEGTAPIIRLQLAGADGKFAFFDNLSIKEIQTVAYWRNEGGVNWTDLSPYGATATYNTDYNELVTNGTFSSNITGWTSDSGAVLTHDSSNKRLVVTNSNDTFALARQTVTLVPGAEYEFKAQITAISSGAVAKVDKTPNSSQTYLSPNFSTVGSHTQRFVATQATNYIQLTAYDADNDPVVNGNYTATFDNISLKRVSNVIKLQEVPLFNRDSLGLPMNRIKGTGLNFEEGYAEIKPRPVTSGNKLSIEAWIYLRDEGFSNQAIYASGSTDILFYRSINNFIRLYINDGNPSTHAGPTCTVSPNEWVHAVAIYDNGKFSMYINGSTSSPGYFEQDPTASAHPGGNINATNTVGTIGKYSGAAYFGGVIDDVKIYNAVLTPSQVKNNYKATKSKHKNSSVPNWSDDFNSNFG